MIHVPNKREKKELQNNNLSNIFTVKTKVIVSKRLHNHVPKRPRR